ncbi:hypothetical protein C3L33_15231, partial [Rhododendron williamsianum]
RYERPIRPLISTYLVHGERARSLSLPLRKHGHFSPPFKPLLTPLSLPHQAQNICPQNHPTDPQIHFTLPSQEQPEFAATPENFPKTRAGASEIGETAKEEAEEEVVFAGEDSAEFDLGKQKITSWIYFTGVLGVVLFVLDVVWIDNSTGFGKAFVDSVYSVSGSHEVAMFMLTLIFAAVHSGLASFRDKGEKLIGERAFRVLFAGTSLPLAVSTVVYFINHRYDGVQLWQLQSVPDGWPSDLVLGTHNLDWQLCCSGSLHRANRAPFIWRWNGDRRLAIRYGDAFETVKSRTSVFPFAAILDGRQKLPEDYYKEFIRLPYLTITALTLGAYFAHPLMQAASYRLHW